MIIRREQIDAMMASNIERFANRMIEHLRRCFRRECASMTESDLRQEIRLGIERARGYGFETELEICKYIDLMFIFERDFDQKVEPWAAACNIAADRYTFYRKWDEAYDALAGETEGRP
jgi:hypothetical protein